MIAYSNNSRETYPRCFWTKEKEIRIKFNPCFALIGVQTTGSRRRFMVIQNVPFEFRQDLHHYYLLWGHLRSLLHPRKKMINSTRYFAIIVFRMKSYLFLLSRINKLDRDLWHWQIFSFVLPLRNKVILLLSYQSLISACKWCRVSWIRSITGVLLVGNWYWKCISEQTNKNTFKYQISQTLKKKNNSGLKWNKKSFTTHFMIILNLPHMENKTYLCHRRTSKIKIHLLRLFESRRAIFRFMLVRGFPTFKALFYSRHSLHIWI